MLSKNRRFLYIVATILMVLLVPLVAMQFTDQVTWTTFDFVVMGMLLLAVGVTCEVILRNVPCIKKRISLFLILLLIFILIWAELAVGIFGTPFAGV